jgi:hypothetical protein
MTGKYILDTNGEPQPEPDLIKWAQWLETADRRIGWASIGDVRVSTIFLGLDHSFGEGDPLLFETMVFWPGHELDHATERYATREEALRGHQGMVDRVRQEAGE